MNLSALSGVFAPTEKHIVEELSAAWKKLMDGAHTVEMDIHGVTTWVQQHHTQIQAIYTVALEALSFVSPASVPVVQTATAAIDLATKKIDALTNGLQSGSVTHSTVVDTYHAVKDAQTAVNAVLKHATSAAPGAAPHVAVATVNHAADHPVTQAPAKS